MFSRHGYLGFSCISVIEIVLRESDVGLAIAPTTTLLLLPITMNLDES
jgi:hypothetical protein